MGPMDPKPLPRPKASWPIVETLTELYQKPYSLHPKSALPCPALPCPPGPALPYLLGVGIESVSPKP